MPFTFTQAGIDGLVIVEPRVFPDDRGGSGTGAADGSAIVELPSHLTYPCRIPDELAQHMTSGFEATLEILHRSINIQHGRGAVLPLRTA